VKTLFARAPRARRFTRRPYAAAVRVVGLTAVVLLADASGVLECPGGTAEASVTTVLPRVSTSLDPFRRTPVAQAEPAPPETPPRLAPTEAETKAAPPVETAKPSPPTAGTTAPRASAPVACSDDSQCPDEHICEQAVCRRIEHRVNVFYLYYQEGTFRELFGLYWSKRGNTGYTVLVPFYWNYFSPKTRSRIVAPFYWHFEDDVAQRTSTVIVPGLPISWSRQPGASSFGIWPLFYKSTKFGWAAPLLGSFEIADPDKGTAWGSVAFLYWWSRSGPGTGKGSDKGTVVSDKGSEAFDTLLPLFVSSRSSASAFTFALPLNFYWRSGIESHTLAIPFFLAHSWKNGSSLYSLLGYYNRQGPDARGSVAWLYWGGRNSKTGDAYDVLFPLIWSFRSPASATSTLFPIVWSLRRGDWSFNTVVPVWWSAGSDDAAGKGKNRWRFRTLIPLFYSSESENGARFSWLTVLGGYRRDDKAGSRTLVLLPGPIVYRRDSQTAIDLVSPLYFRYTDKATDATTRLVSLIFFRRDDPRGSTTALFPIFWRFHDAASGRSTSALLPLFLSRSTTRDNLIAGGVFPLWFYHRTFTDSTGGWSGGLFPLAFFGHRGDASHAVLFPLFWHFASAKGSTTALFPVFFKTGDARGYDAGVLPLLTFFGRRDRTSYQVQFPLFWRFADEGAGRSTTVTPIGFFGSSPEGWRLGVGPLLPIIWAAGGGPRGHFVLFPLLWHFRDDQADKSTTVVANVMHRRHGGEVTDAFFPLFWYRRGARPGGSDETAFTLFPLVHYHRDATRRWLVTPLGASASGPERQAGFVGPYFWYHGKTFTARGIPALYADVTRADTGERTRQFGPVVAIDGPDDRQTRVVFPLFGRHHDRNETDTYVFPTYFRQRKADGYALDSFLPLFWRSTWKGGSTTVVGPYYDRESPGVHNTGLVPLYFWAKNPDRTLLVVPPLLTYHKHDFRAGTSLTWAGPFFHSAETGGGRKDTTILFPLYWAGSDGPRSHRMVLPIYWHFVDAADSRSTLLVPFYWSTRGTTRLRALLPVAWYSRDDVNKSGSEALLPLFYASHGPDHFTLLTLLGGVSRAPDRRRTYVGPIYFSDTVESSTRLVFPLWVSHLNRKSETRTRFFLPLLYFSRGNPEKSLMTVAGLFWRRTDVSSTTTLVLPLLFDVHDLRQSRTTVFLPLFVRHANEVTGENMWLAPLFYHHRTGSDSTNVLFPLIWDFAHEKTRTTVVFPLFAHWTRETYSGTYVFPIFYYRKGLAHGEPDGTWRLFVPPLFDAAVQRPGDLRWEILGGLFGKERIGRNHYLKIFFLTFETQRASASQTSWYGQPRRPSRARPARGLATNSW